MWNNRLEYSWLAIVSLSGSMLYADEGITHLERVLAGKVVITPVAKSMIVQQRPADIYQLRSGRCDMYCIKQLMVASDIPCHADVNGLSFITSGRLGTLVRDAGGGYFSGYMILSEVRIAKPKVILPFIIPPKMKVMDVESNDGSIRNRTLLLSTPSSAVFKYMVSTAVSQGFTIDSKSIHGDMYVLSRRNEEVIMQSLKRDGIFSVMVNKKDG